MLRVAGKFLRPGQKDERIFYLRMFPKKNTLALYSGLTF